MKKFHCPYCGKRCIPFHFKFRLQPRPSEDHRYFQCPECNNNLHKTTGTKGRRCIRVLEALLFIEVLTLPSCLLFGHEMLLFIQLGIFAATTIFISIIYYYFFEFTTELNNYFDYKAEVELMERGILKVSHLVTGKIYTLKPFYEESEEKVLAKRYLIAIKSSKRLKKHFYKCRIHFIQPKTFVSPQKLSNAGFTLLDGEKLIAKGVFRIQKPEKLVAKKQITDPVR